MANDLPPDWAIQAAIDRLGMMSTVHDVISGSTKLYAATRELARMIAKHEEKPDPLAADREFVARMEEVTKQTNHQPDVWRGGRYDDEVGDIMAYLRANVDKITGSA